MAVDALCCLHHPLEGLAINSRAAAEPAYSQVGLPGPVEVIFGEHTGA